MLHTASHFYLAADIDTLRRAHGGSVIENAARTLWLSRHSEMLLMPPYSRLTLANGADSPARVVIVIPDDADWPRRQSHDANLAGAHIGWRCQHALFAA